MTTKTIFGKLCTAVVIDDNGIPNYWVDPSGNIWSTKRELPIMLRPARRSASSKYPMVSLSTNGRGKSIDVHKIVCSTMHKFPVPSGVPAQDWSATPASIKRLVKTLFQVNHIDHDHFNFHPSNLEWVTVSENSAKYQAHRIANGL